MRDFSETFDEFYKNGSVDDLEIAIQKIKEEKASVVDCIRTVKNKLGLTIPEAEALVLASKAWDAEKKEFDRFKEHFFQLATKYHWFH